MNPRTERTQALVIMMLAIWLMVNSAFWLVFWYMNQSVVELGQVAVIICLSGFIISAIVAYTQYFRHGYKTRR